MTESPLPVTPLKLDKPGAGIPFFDSLVLKFFIAPYVAAKSDWDKNRESFLVLSRLVLAEIEGLDDTLLARPVLVPKMRGLEDSSRYWSAAMVLEHLSIVNRDIARLVVSLSKGEVPPGDISTATVKPKGGGNPRLFVEEFRTLVMSLPDYIDSKVQDKTSKAVKKHPWFGGMNALQWQWLLAMHTRIHLKQLRYVVAALKA